MSTNNTGGKLVRHVLRARLTGRGTHDFGKFAGVTEVDSLGNATTFYTTAAK
jgi:hypothetical protein